ncbi:MAG: formimidoylglutamase [Bacteroidota bacterium]
MSTHYTSPDLSLWTGRDNPGYWYQQIKQLSLEMPKPADELAYALLGYACEAGVKRNQGRVGAAAGPDVFRRQMASTAWHLGETQVRDAGNVLCEGDEMEACQKQYAQGIETLLRNGYFPIGIGGGHDIAFGTYSGVRDYLGDQPRLGIINFDAHFDLRVPEDSPNSGTPFFQAYERQQAIGQPFDYLVLGIQEGGNTQTLFDTARQTGTQYFSNQQLWDGVKLGLLEAFFAPLDAIYLTIDLDVFASAFAPGVSAASPMGLDPKTLIHYLHPLLKSGKIIALDFAELSPLYDQQYQTAKLAARLLSYILQTIEPPAKKP